MKRKPGDPRTFLFNFLRQFAPDVESGKKRQTIRATRADGRVPRIGDKVKLYTGLRTGHTRLLLESTVEECFQVQITLTRPRGIVANGVKLAPHEANAFAQRDGFPSSHEFYEYFKKSGCPEDFFEGFCIVWKAP
jgi:hypothetical protein